MQNLTIRLSEIAQWCGGYIFSADFILYCQTIEMSGFEVAGLVLAILPIVGKGLKHWKDHLTRVDAFKGYQWRFDELMTEVDLELTEYRSIMLRLLAPIVADDNVLKELVEDGNCIHWKDTELHSQIAIQLKGNYRGFQTLVRHMHDLLIDLQKILDIQQGQVGMSIKT